MMNIQIFHTLRPDPHRRRKIGVVSGLALALFMLVVSPYATAQTSNAASTANTANTVVKPPATPTAATSAGLLAQDIGRIKQRGELVIAMLATDTPPFFY